MFTITEGGGKTRNGEIMSSATVKDMLKAGVHFGHQTRRWNPKMKPYIYGPRNGIYIINLDVTKRLFDKACDFITEEVKNGGSVLFVGTKRQAQTIINDEAKRSGMYYVDHRWLGGMLTNFQTIKNSIDRLKSIEAMQADGSINRFPKKEILLMGKERIKLERNVGGIKNMRSLPSVLFVVDPRKEAIAVNEAVKLGIPVVAMADTNCDPDNIDFVIPANDDAIRAIRLMSYHIAEAVLTGQALRDGENASEEAIAASMGEVESEIESEIVTEVEGGAGTTEA
jgi:small subunit ribosomal protein S2